MTTKGIHELVFFDENLHGLAVHEFCGGHRFLAEFGDVLVEKYQLVNAPSPAAGRSSTRKTNTAASCPAARCCATRTATNTRSNPATIS